MSAPSVELENLSKAAELAENLKEIRLSISAYDPRDCNAKLKISFRVGSGLTAKEYSTNMVLPVLRAHERFCENELYKLGVKSGPSAESPFEKRKTIYRKICLEIQLAPEFNEYMDAIRENKEEFTNQFENKTAISKQDFLVFHDCVKNGL